MTNKPSSNSDHEARSASETFGQHDRAAHHPAKAFVQVLGVVAAVALVVVAVRIAPRSAIAGDDTTTGLANPIDQRNAMIAELRTLNVRLERIEKRLGAVPPADQPGG